MPGDIKHTNNPGAALHGPGGMQHCPMGGESGHILSKYLTDGVVRCRDDEAVEECIMLRTGSADGCDTLRQRMVEVDDKVEVEAKPNSKYQHNTP